MNLTNLQITIAADGFTITDGSHEIAPGYVLTVRIAQGDQWETRSVPFNPTPTLIEAFFTGARHVFVYTGYTPTRVLIVEGEVPGYNWINDYDASAYRDRVYGGNFACYPEYSSWTDDWLLYFLSGHVTSSLRNDPRFISDFGPDRVINNTTPFLSPPPVEPTGNYDRGVNSSAFVGAAEAVRESSYREPNAY